MNSVGFRDLLFLALLGFVAMVVWMYPHLNPPETDAEAEPPGNVIVAIHWPEGNTDVDIWLTGPRQSRPTGYSNKSGTLFNLLRDDLGNPDDQRNYENAYSRGTPAGEYIVNVHLYRGTAPITVEVEVSINDGKPGKASLRKLVKTTVTLTGRRQEKTAIRFELDGNAKLVPNSVNSVDRPLRSQRFGDAGPDYGG